MNLKIRDLAIPLAVAVVVAVGTSRCHDATVSEWETRAVTAEALAEVRMEEVQRAKEIASEFQIRADSLAEMAESRAPEIRERIVRVREETPDSMENHPAVTARDAIIEDLTVESTRWREAFAAEREASASLRVALDAAIERGDSLLAVVEDRPGQRPWYIPRLGLGPSVGVGQTGTYSGIGVNLSWEIKL